MTNHILKKTRRLGNSLLINEDKMRQKAAWICVAFEQKKQCFVKRLFSNNLVTRSSIHNVSAVTYVKDRMALQVM